MRLLLWVLLGLCTASQTVLAGANVGGTLIIHDAGVTFSSTPDLPVPPPSTPPADCSAVDNSAPAGAPDEQCVWKVYAAFPAWTSPRVKGLAWGIRGTGSVYVTRAGLPDLYNDLEISSGNWPNPAMSESEYSATGQSFGNVQTSHLIECHWFGGYAYEGSTFSTVRHEAMGTEFADDGVPIQVDPIVGFSAIGFGVPGDTQCPTPLGACCTESGYCLLTRQAGCPSPDVWQGEWSSCEPNPCEPAPSASIIPWGRNDVGQCQGPATNTDLVGVAAGSKHSVALRSDGSVAAWGSNSDNQCIVPAPNAGFVSIGAGWWHSLGIRPGGSIVAWGRNQAGQCDVPGPNEGFTKVAGGWGHSVALRADGTIVAWGRNVEGQCDVPQPNHDFVSVAAGTTHNLGLKSGGSIWAWGDNARGQCDVPVPNTEFVAIAGGDEHSVGLKANGSIVCWGDNVFHQCDVPAPNADFVAIAAGGRFSLGLRSDGSVVAWGYNSYGACDVPSPNTGFTAVAAGKDHVLGLRARGSSACCRNELPAPLWRVAPNPSRGSIRFTPPEPGGVRIEVFDPAGRIVRVLEDAGGSHPIEWDGRDEAGRTVAAGVYAVRLRSESGSSVRNVVMTR